MSAASLQAFRQTVTIKWPQATQANAKTLLLRVAREGNAKILADARAKTGAEPQWDAYANTPGNTNLESVVLPGPIVYRYRYTRAIIQDALDALRKASPVRSGTYVRAHTVYVNGAPVDKPPVTLNAGDEIIIANPVPYARRIEIGKTESGRDFVIQVSNRIYERTAGDLRSKYRNIANISFEYISPPSSDRYSIKGALKGSYKGKNGKLQKRRGHGGETVRAPAIVITIKQ